MINFFLRFVYFSGLLLAGGASFVFFALSYFEPIKLQGDKKFQLKPGNTAYQTSINCYSTGLIRAPLAFLAFSKYRELNHKLKPGSYHFASGTLTLKSLFETLVKGEVKSGLLVTIPPGLPMRRLAPYLIKKGVMNAESNFMDIAENYPVKNSSLISQKTIFCEGFLYPDTYEFYPNSSPKQIIGRMIKRFHQVCTDQLKNIESFEKLEEILKLASIIEMESGHLAEKRRIAGVFTNRVKRGIPLQSDATLQYIFKERKKRVYYKDLEIDSPYNSYKNRGLPPTPICSPRIDSIKAAMNPEKHSYLYFVANARGSHVFSKSLREHNRKKRKYLKAKGWK